MDPVPGGLWLVGGDGYLLSDELIHQGGFSYVWPANQGGKAGFIICFHSLFLIPVPQAFACCAFKLWGCRKIRQQTFPIFSVRLFSYILSDMDGYCLGNVRPEQTECT